MTRFSIGALLIVAFFGAGCSGDSGGLSQTSASAPVESDIDMSDYRFAPAALTVKSGTNLELNLSNSGSVVHNWTVLANEITAESEFDENTVLFAGEALAGAQRAYVFEPSPAGVYQVICTIPTHFSLGMVGTLTVAE